LIIVGVIACSTKKNTAITRSYHNLTSRYNILFNGTQSFKLGIQKLETSYDDDFTELLPVFLYTSEDALSSIAGEMERSIAKATKLISMHSLTVKPKKKPKKELSAKQKEFYNKKEYNKWADEAYLLMGKAHFYQKKYSMATESFNYMISNFGQENTAYEARLWLARIAIQEKRLREALDILNELSKNILIPKKLNGEIYATWADYYLKQDQYSEAIDNLTKAVDLTRRKIPKARYYYLLAQLHAKTDNNVKAAECFNKVIRMNPPYKMAFNAKINRALAYQGGAGSRKDIEKQLNKMLKDDKNIDFQDQIYYAIGQLYLKDGNKPEAMVHFKKSLQASTTNNQQKAKSSLIIADLYYERPDYVNAQSYYDTTVTFISPDFPDYQTIFIKSTSLSNLVNSMNTVHFEDSVLNLSKKPQPELFALIDKVIEDETEREQELKRLQAEENMNRMQDFELNREITTSTVSTGWYFYNPTLKTLGQKEFIKLWGNRKLEDNWRRKNKSTVSNTEITQNEGEEGDDQSGTKAKSPVINKRSRQYYLKDIPFSDSAKIESNKRIANSLYTMGEVYHDELKDYPKAAESYEELLRRYPKYDNRLQAYYKLHLMAKQNNKTDQANMYKQKIVNEFPGSSIAMMLTNPNYHAELKAQEQAKYDYYLETFNFFNSKNYSEAGRRAEKAIVDNPAHELRPKYEYIYTVSAGLSKDTAQFVIDLQKYIDKYPRTDLAENAQIMVNYLLNKNPNIYEIQQQVISRELYSAKPYELHYFAYIVPSNAGVNQLVFNIINYNIDNFSDLNLEVTKSTLNPQTNICLVSKFPNGEDAMKYYRSITANDSIFNDVGVSHAEAIIISQSNYTILNQNQKPEQYLYFFKENYK